MDYNKYKDIFIYSFDGYYNYLIQEITQPHWKNYFYWLIAISVAAWLLEILLPWRKKQALFRKDFWLDGFYMFFNFFLFSLIGYNALSNIFVELFNDFLLSFGIENIVAIQVANQSVIVQFLIMFILADFIQWNTHRLLHRVPFLWEFHKVHHSVQEMGFAAHLRFHWMETIIYKSIQFIPLTMIGFGIKDFFILHIFTITIGHLNHSNLSWDYGFLRYILNNPKMHIWHHAKELPQGKPYGVNFGISLSLWDYLFSTNYIPKSGKDIPLGFENVENFPKGFMSQFIYPIGKPRHRVKE